MTCFGYDLNLDKLNLRDVFFRQAELQRHPAFIGSDGRKEWWKNGSVLKKSYLV